MASGCEKPRMWCAETGARVKCHILGRGLPVSAVVYRETRIEPGSWLNAPSTRPTPEPDELRAREPGQTRISRGRVSLNSHICSVLRDEEPCLSSEITIRRRVDPDLWAVAGDDRLLYELVLALALNAVDAIDEDGRVTFETRNLHLEEGCITRATGLRPGFYVLLTVEDTGRGMDAQTLARVFEPASPSERLATRPVLAGVKHIAERHRGHVCVASAPGEGTVVRVYLPAEPPGSDSTGALPAR